MPVHPSSRPVRFPAALAIVAVTTLLVLIQGFAGTTPLTAQTILTGPVLPPLPAVGAPGAPLGLGSATYIVPGQYCNDKTGGQIYIPDGSPIPAGITCPTGTTGGTSGMAMPVASPTPAASAPASSAGPPSVTQTTASYRVELDVESPQTMIMPDQAANATSGEVMVMMPGMSMDTMMAMMSMTDQGQPVNHHVEAHIYDKATGVVISDVMPTISIMNQATNSSRDLQSLMAMYDVTVGTSDLHFGDNVYLPNGIYTITVTIGQENAVFKDVQVTGGASSTTAR